MFKQHKQGLFLLLFTSFFCFSSELIQDRKIFREVVFPIPELTYFQVLDKDNLLKIYSKEDVVRMIKACNHFKDYKVNGKPSQNDVLRNSSCLLLKKYYKEGVFNEIE